MLKQIIELEEEIQIRKETKWVIKSPISNIAFLLKLSSLTLRKLPGFVYPSNMFIFLLPQPSSSIFSSSLPSLIKENYLHNQRESSVSAQHHSERTKSTNKEIERYATYKTEVISPYHAYTQCISRRNEESVLLLLLNEYDILTNLPP